MKLGKLGKTVRREIAASPKRQPSWDSSRWWRCIFWAPLVLGSNRQGQNHVSAEPTPAAAAQASAGSPAKPTAVADAASRLPSWEQVVQWMHDDPRTATVTRLARTRDPFDCPTAKVAKTKADEKPEPHPPAVTPSTAGLVLTGTIIGPQRRLAQINGRTYALGKTIEIAKDKESVRAVFKLIDVQPRRAVLQAGGEKFELTIPEPGKSGKIELLVPNRWACVGRISQSVRCSGTD